MSQHIDRRTFLRGAGAAVALPILEAMIPSSVMAQSVPAALRPVRMGFLFVPNGMSMPHWTPTAEGSTFELPSVLQPLAGVRNSMNVLTGLAQHNAFELGDGPGDHARSAAAWLTGVHPKKTAGDDIHLGISVDQLAAQRNGKLTRFASLEIGCERGAQAGNCDSGYSCAYTSSISWRGERTPVAKEVNPRAVFERLFGDGKDQVSIKRRDFFRQSILDVVLDDASKLRGQLGHRDQNKLDEYFTCVREIEQRLARFESENAAFAMAAGHRPDGIPADFAEHIRLMGDMMVLAFQADLTRVCSFMFANDGNNRNYKEIGVSDGHHEVSHHGTDASKLEAKKKIDTFHVEQLAYILGKMNSIKEVDGHTLLDNSMIVYGAGISDGDRHNHDDLPVLFAGKAGGAVVTGRHIRYAPNTPMTNLYVSMLDRVGIHGEKLGDSTGSLPGLF